MQDTLKQASIGATVEPPLKPTEFLRLEHRTTWPIVFSLVFGPLRVLLVAAWFGLLAGLIEGVFATLSPLLPGFAIRTSPEILWIAPAFNLVLFIVIGAALRALFRLTGKSLPLRWEVGVFTAITAFCFLLLLGKFHQIAAVVLSLGVGCVMARRLRGRESRAVTLFRKSSAVLLALTILVGVTGASWNFGRERYLANKIPQPRPNSPNVVLITLDTLRADHLASYGYPRATSPNLDRLAHQGILFEQAFANSSWTLPTHASLFTGRLPHEHKADWWQPLNENYKTLAEALLEQGYLTAAFSANTWYATPEWGLDRGFTRFEASEGSLIADATRTVYGKRLAVNILPRLGYYDIPGRRRAASINNDLFAWLDRSSGHPFFVFLNYFDLHDPYLTDAPYQTRFSSEVTRGDLINFQFQPRTFRRKPSLTKEEVQTEIDSYDGCLAYLDAKIGELFTELERRGVAKNTLVIITSDHGEAFGGHDLFGHGNSLYLETLRVPLIFLWPGKLPAGARVNQIVSLRDIPATIMELIGDGSQQFPGTSLVNLWSRKDAIPAAEPILSELSPGRFKEGPPNYPVTKGGLRSLLTDKWHFILSESGEAELYAWREDPNESNNLANTSVGRPVVDEFKQRLTSRPATEGN